MAEMAAPKKKLTEQFARKLRALLEDRVQKAVAEEAGVSTQALSRYLRGDAPRPHVALQLARALKVDPIWLIDESDESLDPKPARSAVEGVPARDLIQELQRRYDQLARSINSAADRAERLPWERAAIWLLRKLHVTDQPPVVKLCVDTYKEIQRLGHQYWAIKAHAHPSSEGRDWLVGVVGSTDRSMTHEIDARMKALTSRPGCFAMGHWVIYFDDEYKEHSPIGRSDHDWSNWEDRRAWLLAQLVTHESAASEPEYDPIREKLRKVGYIDADGKPRDYPKAMEPLGEFALSEPA